MAGLGGHLVAGDRGEIGGGAGGFLYRPIVGVVIMVGGYSEFDAFPGDGVHALMFGRIAMTASGECVDVSVGGD